MAHDRMTNDDLDRNMRGGQEDEFGGQQDKQTPGRGQQDQQTGQKGAGQKNNQPGFGNEEDDFEQGGGAGGYGGSKNPGQGQNR